MRSDIAKSIADAVDCIVKGRIIEKAGADEETRAKGHEMAEATIRALAALLNAAVPDKEEMAKICDVNSGNEMHGPEAWSE